jgi:hypothetical protein
MDELIACERCRRHVFVRDPRCPFCGADVGEAPPLRPVRGVGPITRAVLFCGASALGACAAERSEPPAAPAPPTEVTVEPAGEPAPAAPAAPAGAAETPEAEAEAYAVGPVELPPEPAEVRRRERAHAEGRKRARRRPAPQSARIRQIPPWHRDSRFAQPYGAPPADLPIV